MTGTARPAAHFAIPPYRAKEFTPGRAGIMNAQGINCLTFVDKPGAVFTDMEAAEAISACWNKPDFTVTEGISDQTSPSTSSARKC